MKPIKTNPLRILAAFMAMQFYAPTVSAETNVRTLGVAGDGVEDDGPALEAALAAGQTELFFPKGIYRLTRPLVLDLAKTGSVSLRGNGSASIRMEGRGPALRLTGSHGGTADPKTVQETVWARERMPVVAGLEIVGGHPEADGVEADGTMQLTLERLLIRRTRHGVHLVNRNRNVIIASSHIYENSGAGVFLDAVNLHQINIHGCHISYNGGGGVVSRGGEVRNLQVSGCDIEANHTPAGPESANILLDSTGGSIAEVSVTGCTLQHTHKAPGSANIRILGEGRDAGLERRTGTGKTREGNVTIGNNIFSDVQVSLEIRNARGVTVTGNTFWEGFEEDLRIMSSSHVVVAGNNFDRNPRYQINGFANAEQNGVVFRDCADSIFQGNTVAGVHGKRSAVEILGCARMQIAGNSIMDSDGAGLWLEDVSHSMVTGNLIRDDRPEKRQSEPLHVTGGKGNLIQGNLLREE